MKIRLQKPKLLPCIPFFLVLSCSSPTRDHETGQTISNEVQSEPSPTEIAFTAFKQFARVMFEGDCEMAKSLVRKNDWVADEYSNGGSFQKLCGSKGWEHWHSPRVIDETLTNHGRSYKLITTIGIPGETGEPGDVMAFWVDVNDNGSFTVSKMSTHY